MRLIVTNVAIDSWTSGKAQLEMLAYVRRAEQL